jgi:plastocyanin/FtsP/CotA-like multicopper oxidase with cupredoxin domain
MATIEYWIQIENHPWDACPDPVDRATGKKVVEATGRIHEVVLRHDPDRPGRSKTTADPAYLSLQPGDAVRWTNRDTRPHVLNARNADPSIPYWVSPPIPPGRTWMRRFTAPDTYFYIVATDPPPSSVDDPQNSGPHGRVLVVPGPVVQLTEQRLVSPTTRRERVVRMSVPLDGEALILRRYTANWRQPEDRKVNPWDLNEPDPGERGTMGTIPGATISCEVGDTVRVHFRNADARLRTVITSETAYGGPSRVEVEEALPRESRTHSLHTHGFDFAAAHDGAFPVSPPDLAQPIDAIERHMWDAIGVTGPYKQGDRVPPGATFTYTWVAGNDSSAGVWLYHDHSICGAESTNLGAVGMIVISRQGEPAPVLPDDSWVGSPIHRGTTDLGDRLRLSDSTLALLSGETLGAGPVGFRTEAQEITQLEYLRYRVPPERAQFLLLFHELSGVGMCINGRRFLGNTPTLVAGPRTRMEFGVAALGNAFHTFHVHGHRWPVRGGGAYEDTRTFGPGDSFAVTIDNSTRAADSPPRLGEWHLHCHVEHHMMTGMAGSLLVVEGGEVHWALPVGMPCGGEVSAAAPERPPQAPADAPRAGTEHRVRIGPSAFAPAELQIRAGDTVTWTNYDDAAHSVHADDQSWMGPLLSNGKTWSQQFPAAGSWLYHCHLHQGMRGRVTVA